jgi:hypothetical protein
MDMNDEEGEYPDYLAGSDFDDASTPVEGLQERIEGLENRIDDLQNRFNQLSQSAVSGLYLLGTAIAVVLSWSRNASILWCILHGILSWIYVIYFAITR